MPEAVSEKKLEQKLEKKVEKALEPRLEKEIEKKVEARLEKSVGKSLEQKVEKRLAPVVEKSLEKKLGKDLGIPKIAEPKAAIVDFSKDALAKSSVSIHVDDYEFIFSDFDPRPFQKRALSEDFLREAKRFAVETRSGSALELSILLPSSSRKPEIEAIVKKRLREHFRNSLLEVKREHDWIVNRGSLMVLAGFAMTLGAAAIAYYLGESSFLFVLLFVILEPAGWFTFWTGLDQLFYQAREAKPNLSFYEKMSRAEIGFSSY